MMNRRHLLQGLAAGVGACALPGGLARAATTPIAGAPKRIIFFLQNQGFDPLTCIPKGLNESCSLDGVTLAEPMKELEPYKDRMHVITGLHGQHTSPSHSAYFGALGGYRGGIGVPPAGATIDHVLSQHLPQTILPHLCLGMDSMENMQSRPTLATLSASGAAQPIFMHSDPNALYQMLFGSISSGEVRERYEARSKVFREVERLAGRNARDLPAHEQARYSGFVHGFRDMNGLRERLTGMSDQLKQVAPTFDRRYTHPTFETDWHDALLEIGLAALQANVTNVLTIGSGRGEIFGAWKGLGVTEAGHNLGHMKQPDNPIWVKIRQYNTRMLVKLMKGLEAIPEGSGTMMDNTLIVYTSNNADKQHTNGANWPVVLLGNAGGRFKTGQFTHVDGRPLNDLYTTLLHGIGAPVDRFNISTKMAAVHNSHVGPIESLLA